NVVVTAQDPSGNTSTCSFTVTVLDREPPTLSCPSDMTAMADFGKCTAAVAYPNPTVSDNAPGVRVEFSPPAGTQLPIGTNRIDVTAIDASGNKTSCSFNVTVTGMPQAKLALEGDAGSLDFGPINPGRRQKRNPPSRMFSIENIGCAPLNLTFFSILRLGGLVDGGTIVNPNDNGVFGLRVLNDDGTESFLDAGASIIIG